MLESRHLVGGAAVTEEVLPGFKFSACSYVISLLRPWILRDLDPKSFAGADPRAAGEAKLAGMFSSSSPESSTTFPSRHSRRSDIGVSTPLSQDDPSAPGSGSSRLDSLYA